MMSWVLPTQATGSQVAASFSRMSVRFKRRHETSNEREQSFQTLQSLAKKMHFSSGRGIVENLVDTYMFIFICINL